MKTILLALALSFTQTSFGASPLATFLSPQTCAASTLQSFQACHSNIQCQYPEICASGHCARPDSHDNRCNWNGDCSFPTIKCREHKCVRP